MIFDRHTAHQIIRGEVTRFYRPVRGPRAGWAEGERHKLEVLRSVSWLHAERKSDDDGERQVLLGFIRIVDVDDLHLSGLTEEDTKAAGWTHRSLFIQWWRDEYGTGPLDPDARCWAVTFELDREHVPRLLHRDSQHGYTNDPRLALAEEPEAVDVAAQVKITSEAGRIYSVTHADEERRRAARSLSAQLKEETSRAQREGIDIDDNVERIRAELDEIRRKRQDAA